MAHQTYVSTLQSRIDVKMWTNVIIENWVLEMRLAFNFELSQLSKASSKLSIDEEALLNQVGALKSVEQKLKYMVHEEDIVVDGQFISNVDIDTLNVKLH